MFNLVYRDGAPENTGHYEILDTIPETVFIVGQLVSIEGGKAAAYASGKPYGVVAIGTNDDATKATAAYDQIAVLKIDSDMIFKTICGGSSTDPVLHTNHKKGNIVSFVKDNIGNELVTSGYGFEITDVTVTSYVNGVPSSGIVEGRFVKAD
jgi:hypothetical protein